MNRRLRLMAEEIGVLFAVAVVGHPFRVAFAIARNCLCRR